MEPVSNPQGEQGKKTAEWWYRRAALVYFIAAGEPPVAIKIGVTTIKMEKANIVDADWLACIRQRHLQIQSSNHETLKLLGIIRFKDGDWPARKAEDREKELHKKFAALQKFKAFTSGAEWFKPGPELLAYIDENAEKLTGYPGIIALPINL